MRVSVSECSLTKYGNAASFSTDFSGGEREAAVASVAMADATSRPPALVASCVFGAIGVVLLLAGVITSSIPVLVASGLAGALSLTAALVWRAQLIDEWRRQHPPDARGRHR